MIASLDMYPFEHLRGSYDRLWAAIRSRLPGAPESLSHELDLHDVWRHPDLLLGQTCGWPLVTALPDVVVVGAFDMAVPFARAGRYRSVLIASKPLGIDHWKSSADTRVAINGYDSLSGWVSLCQAWGGLPSTVLETGAHVQSMRLVAEGGAEVASIDAASFEFVAATMPTVAGRVHVIGHGPMVPSLPLVMAPANAPRLDEVRAAVSGAVAEPAMAADCARLRISGFVPFDRSDYLPLLALEPPKRH